MKLFALHKFLLISGLVAILWGIHINNGLTIDRTIPIRHTITISMMKFTPENLVIKKGDTVVWVNKDIVDHDATDEKNKAWASGPLKKGESWSKVITKDEQYYCSIHVVMKGTIKVNK